MQLGLDKKIVHKAPKISTHFIGNYFFQYPLNSY
jgi:hypothetical protein